MIGAMSTVRAWRRITPSASSPLSSRSSAALHKLAAISLSSNNPSANPKRPGPARHETLGRASFLSLCPRSPHPPAADAADSLPRWRGRVGVGSVAEREFFAAGLWDDPARADGDRHARAEPTGGAEAAAERAAGVRGFRDRRRAVARARRGRGLAARHLSLA